MMLHNRWVFAIVAILVVHFAVVGLAHMGYLSVTQYGNVRFG